jgi:hypothetical protein
MALKMTTTTTTNEGAGTDPQLVDDAAGVEALT